jgi:ribosomal-protein-alanine N-acetyltransferase
MSCQPADRLRPPRPDDFGDAAVEEVLRPVEIASLSELLRIEQASYEFPWSRGNFIDSLAAGYLAEALHGPDGEMRAYCIAMWGVDEMHLLNLTVAPAWRRRGLACRLLDMLVARCRAQGARQLWLEVRTSNTRAREVYERYGFRHVGLRRGYYPAAGGKREDAQVMNLKFEGAAGALD